MNHIEIMVSVQNKLHQISADEQNEEWIAIAKLVAQYIETKCQHHIVHDLIDITPDTSKTICYCTYCEKTFP